MDHISWTDDLAVGVAFKRQDGRKGEIVSTGKGFAIKYAADSKTAWQDDRDSLMGIYDTTWSWTPTDEYYVGGGPGGYYSFKFSGKPPVPEAEAGLSGPPLGPIHHR